MLARHRSATSLAVEASVPCRSYRRAVRTSTWAPNIARIASSTASASGSITPGRGCTSIRVSDVGGAAPIVAVSRTGSARSSSASCRTCCSLRSPWIRYTAAVSIRDGGLEKPSEAASRHAAAPRGSG